MGGGSSMQISLKALLKRKIEAGHGEDFRETLGTFIITVDPDDRQACSREAVSALWLAESHFTPLLLE